MQKWLNNPDRLSGKAVSIYPDVSCSLAGLRDALDFARTCMKPYMHAWFEINRCEVMALKRLATNSLLGLYDITAF